MTVKFFARAAEIAGCDSVQTDAAGNLKDLRIWLTEQWPSLHDTAFVTAVNLQIIHDENHQLNSNDEIAILPPFSGG